MKSVVLLSGGIDSTTALALASEQGSVLAVSFDYGQKHIKELDAAEVIAAHYNARWQHVTLPSWLFSGSAITSGGPEVPTGTYEEVQGTKDGPISTYVPFRNGQLLSAATALAVKNEANMVWFAAHASDAARWAYPDCSPKFIRAISDAIHIGTDYKVSLIAPFSDLEKWQVVRIGTDKQVPYGLTWSCYKGLEVHCGVCPTCQERRSAFTKAGANDPTTYGRSTQ